jgi:type IV pilus assembly protein PilM
MAKSILGIEIGNSRLKIAEVSGGKVLRFASTEVLESSVQDDLPVSYDAIGQLLKETVKENHFGSKRCALVIPDRATFVRRLSMPVMTPKQLEVNLPYEFHDVIPEDMDKYIYDYAMIGIQKNEEGKAVEMELLGAAVSKDLIENDERMFTQAGLKLIKAAPRVSALEKEINALSEDNRKGDFALLDLGFAVTRVDIFRDGIYEVTRTIDAGLRDVANAAAEVLNCDPHIARQYLMSDKDHVLSNENVVNVYSNIAVEVMRAINYYTYENQDNTLDKLYYCGGGAYLRPFVQEVANNVSLELLPLSDFDEGETDALISSHASVGITME